ncbi:prenyltransferase [Aeromicrobium marinum]|uniref:prenyltransferase n=1 Tax=Aeromicrobium marinum TaxID=219314 RepID=UPI001FE1AADE|nr:prenyltransferase [Aeromicrobium marinum]
MTASPVTPEQVASSAAWIVGQQDPSGAIPWSTEQHLDPWDHVQSAMGLAAAGRITEAERAYAWSRENQQPDGSWAARYLAGAVDDDHLDTNFVAYLATGVWHHWLVTGDRAFVERMWPAVDAALACVLTCAQPGGAIAWTRGTDEVLVAGNGSIHLSLRCGAALAGLVGARRPAWDEAARAIREVFATSPDGFTPKPHSMDWYYPVLGGALTGDAAEARIKEGWDTFVVDGFGIRCVTPNPWVTGAETCELALALDAIGRTDDARTQLAAMQHLRDDDGSYWTGLVVDDRQLWPVEHTTWTAATVILAHDALTRGSGGSGIFRGDGLPA